MAQGAHDPARELANPSDMVARAGSPPSRVEGSITRPGKGGLLRWAVAEYSVYLVALSLLLVAIWIWYRGAIHTLDAGTLELFSGEGNFLLAATAILVVVFEVRKERKMVERRPSR